MCTSCNCGTPNTTDNGRDVTIEAAPVSRDTVAAAVREAGYALT